MKLPALLGLACLALTIAVATSYAPLLAVDNTVADGLHGYALGHPGVVAAMQVWTNAFEPLTFQAILTAVALWLWWRRRPLTAAWTVVAVLVCAAMDTGLKVLIGRMRPHWTHPVSEAVGNSFPSGHSLTSALGCAILLILAWPKLGRRARIAWSTVAVAVPVVTGYTRLGLGVHFLSDVVGGWLLAATLVAAMLLVLRQIGRQR